MRKSLQLLIAAVISCACIDFTTALEWHFEYSGGAPNKLVWQAETGYSYDLWFSGDLGGWIHVDGFPKAGTGGAMEHAFSAGTRGFFKISSEASAPEGFVQIPAGSFEMGDNLSYGIDNELPVHTVSVSAFYMQATVVTHDQMAAVLQWAYEQGGRITVSSSSVRNVESNQELFDLDDDYCRITWDGANFAIESAKGSGYPCVSVTWYGAAAYCNYLSLMQSPPLTPCYNLSDWTCNFSANGYRLPTEAEWEKAARGGLGGKRFPWGDTINHSHANYLAHGSDCSFDTSPYTSVTYHPDWDDLPYPFTSPVETFTANGYGLYDMAGNVWEWCNDWYSSSYYETSPGSDPTGPGSGSYRVFRGGDWGDYAFICRVAQRRFYYPDASSIYYGFRPVRR